MVVKFAGTFLQDTIGYDIYKIFDDLFLSQEKRETMVIDGIQSKDLCKIRSGSADKKTSGVDTEKQLNAIYRSKYRIRLDYQILTDHSVFYPQAFFNDLSFELTLAPASQVVKGSDLTKLKYKLTNIQLEYKIIHSNTLAEEAHSIYESGKEFLYDHMLRDTVVPIAKDKDERINIKVNPQRRSLKAILLLFVEPYTAGTRDSEKYVFPDLTKVEVTVNGKPNMLYNHSIESMDMWEEASRFFVKEKNKTEHMNMTKFYTEDKFGLLIDLRSMSSQTKHGSGMRLVNTKDGVQLEIQRKGKGLGNVNCHTYVISDSQFNMMDRQLDSVQF